MRHVSTGFRGSPAMCFLRAAIPVEDYAVHIADDDGVVSELQQFGLKLSAGGARRASFCAFLPSGFSGHVSDYLEPGANGDENRSQPGRGLVLSPGGRRIAGGYASARTTKKARASQDLLCLRQIPAFKKGFVLAHRFDSRHQPIGLRLE